MPHTSQSARLFEAERLQSSGELQGAVEVYRGILKVDPRCSAAWNNLGSLFASVKDWTTAVTFLQEACRLAPQKASSHNNFANALFRSGRIDESIQAYRSAIALAPSDPTFHNNLAGVLMADAQWSEAADALNQALTLREGYAEAHANLGFYFHHSGDDSKAIEHYRRSIELRPDYALAHHSLSKLLLRRGDLLEGWAEQEWRWADPEFTSPRRNFSQPQWRGEPLHGRTILLHAEQGFGDTIQFVRYVPSVADQGGTVILEVHPELKSLMRSLPGVFKLVARGEALPPFDVHCPLLSLPLAFGTTSASIPSNTPYLSAGKIETGWIDNRPGQFRVGLVWAGNPENQVDRNRSLPLEEFVPLASMRNVTFYSLQRGRSEKQEVFPFNGMLPSEGRFEVTAAAVQRMDLVISVDTATAHLAGALDKPVWILLPEVADWRWGTNMKHSAWYPNARLYRTTAKDGWKAVMQQVMQELSQIVESAE